MVRLGTKDPGTLVEVVIIYFDHHWEGGRGGRRIDRRKFCKNAPFQSFCPPQGPTRAGPVAYLFVLGLSIHCFRRSSGAPCGRCTWPFCQLNNNCSPHMLSHTCIEVLIIIINITRDEPTFGNTNNSITPGAHMVWLFRG